MGMMPKFASPAADYVERRLSLDEICISKPSATYLLRAAGQALAVGIHADALLVVDSSATPVHGSIIVAAEEGVHVLRRLRLYPNRALEFLDGSGREKEIGYEDSEEGIEVFGVVIWAVNDMRTCEWDDLPVI
ncbi:LexA family transcriptional regulator [Serratia marcescens]|uniref:HumD family translesion DNA polymerase n=1 Tax=Serratia TaxID=613 RepID=UPI0013DA35D3|nr:MULTISPECIES: S24 family peptidase [Serratia]MBE4973538.1 LexA family transcriptional regulator [Serratia sp. X3]MBH2686489.1 LexA family transcriptional regulator [Serratia ureilytica]MBH2771202.1 LexA family transcriptional regulator [Serratia marcescens]MBN5214054.1 LexA family transcriptional regulator [Serratia ureilytica]